LNSEPTTRQTRRFRTSLWVSTTYFAEGFPYCLVRLLSSVYFTDIGVREAIIGYQNWLGIPWNLKFIWAPLVDFVGSKRGWMIKIQFIISLLWCLLAFVAVSGPNGSHPSEVQIKRLDWGTLQNTFDPFTGIAYSTILLFIIGIFVVVAFLSATNDIAIDAYYLEGLHDKSEQAAYSGLRIAAYRVAVIVAKFVLVALPTWLLGFGVGALLMLAVSIFHLVYAPHFESDISRQHKPLGEAFTHFSQAWRSYFDQPRLAVMLFFMATYKIGDDIMFSMNTPFLMRELLVSKAQLSWLSGIIGTLTTILGGLIGGYYINRVGLKRAIWPITLIMNLNIWAYAWLAHVRPLATSHHGLTVIALLHGYEYFAAGLGNAALVVYLLYTCKPEYKAAHYAVGSAIMSVGATFIGGFTGRWVEHIGYFNLYVIAFVASLPSMIALLALPINHEAQAKIS